MYFCLHSTFCLSAFLLLFHLIFAHPVRSSARDSNFSLDTFPVNSHFDSQQHQFIQVWHASFALLWHLAFHSYNIYHNKLLLSLYISVSNNGPVSCLSLYSNYLTLCLVYLRRHTNKDLPDEWKSFKIFFHLKKRNCHLYFVWFLS